MTKKKVEVGSKFDFTKIANAELLKEHNKLLKINKDLIEQNKSLQKTITSRQVLHDKNINELVRLAQSITDICDLEGTMTEVKRVLKLLNNIENKSIKNLFRILDDEFMHVDYDIDINLIKKFEKVVQKIALYR